MIPFDMAKTVVAVAPHALARRLKLRGFIPAGRSNVHTETVLMRCDSAEKARAIADTLQCVWAIDDS